MDSSYDELNILLNLIYGKNHCLVDKNQSVGVVNLVKQQLSVIVLFFLLVSVSRGQEVGTYAGEFLQLGTGARSLALGGAAIAYIDDASVGYWNPASAAYINHPTVTAMHEARFDNTVVYDFAAFAAPIGKEYGFAFSVLHIGISDIKDTRSAFVDRNNNAIFDGDDYLDYSKVSSFGNYDWGFLVSIGKQKDSTLSYGATAKLILRKLDPTNKATGIGFDAGLRYKITPEATLALVVQDVTTTFLSYSSGTKELISPTLKIGGTYNWAIFDDEDHHLMPVLDVDMRFESRGKSSQIALGPISLDTHWGLEYRYKDIISVRGGYNDLNMFSVGAGLNLPKLSFDYAFMSFNGQEQLGNTHRISFSLRLEQDKWKR